MVQAAQTIKEALYSEFGDIIKTSSVVIGKVGEDEIRVVIKNPLVAGEVFLRQEKLLRRINGELGKANRKVKRIYVSS